MVIAVILVSDCRVSTDEDEYKASAQEVTLQELSLDLDNYRNKDLKFQGQVLTDVGSLDDTIYLGYPYPNDTAQGIVLADIPMSFENEQDTLKRGDIITVYGKISGISTFSVNFASTEPGRSFSYSGSGYNFATMYIER